MFDYFRPLSLNIGCILALEIVFDTVNHTIGKHVSVFMVNDEKTP